MKYIKLSVFFASVLTFSLIMVKVSAQIQCGSSACQQNECCLEGLFLGEPHCAPLLRENQLCSSQDPPTNNGGLYSVTCICAEGLVCGGSYFAKRCIKSKTTNI